MDWIRDNLQLLIFIGATIAYWINQSRKGWDGSAAGEEDASDETSRPHPPLSPRHQGEDPEQVRRIQEEIRRKIAERRAAEAGAPPAWAEPEPVEAPPLPSVWDEPPPPPPLPAQPVRAYSVEADTASLDRQRRLSEQLAEAERAKVAARQKLADVWDRPAVAAAKRSAARRHDGVLDVHETLRDRAALRRAWIMREVLEKPVALR